MKRVIQRETYDNENGETENDRRILVGKPVGMLRLLRPRWKLKDVIKMNLTENNMTGN
jgi:hypothetical protein